MEQRKGTKMKYFGREITVEELELIKEIVNGFGSLSVSEISRTVSELLEWKRPSGGLKSHECRQMLEEMRDEGMFRLPEVRGAGARGPRIVKETVRGESQAEINGRAGEFEPLELRKVKARSEESRLWRELVNRYHYLGYRAAVGASLRYLVYSGQRGGEVLGCLLWTSPAWKIEARDQWIGWEDEVRSRNLQLIVSNSRFLILPWVRVEHLASKILGRSARQVPEDWERMYGYRPLLLETMVDTSRYRGTCYRAANWIGLGKTKGRGRMDRDHVADGRAEKMVYVYPLHGNAKERLLTARGPRYCEEKEEEYVRAM
jgi:hypothetical protein